MSKGKKESRFWIKLVWGLVIILFSSIVALWITGYSFVFKTLVYTYPDIDDLDTFNSRMVTDKSGRPWPVSTQYNKINPSPELQSVLKEYETVAFLVVRNDSLLYEEYNDGYSTVSQSNSFSVAKSIVSILVGIAGTEGKLNLDDKVGKYIPEFSKTRNSKLTIRHLLMMSSGLNWDESYSSLFSKTTEAYYGSDLKGQMKKLKVVNEPGQLFQYMSCNTEILGMILEEVTGKKLSDYASEKLWVPLHAEQPAFWSLDDADGMEKAYCCFYSSARDFARIGKLYLDSGKVDGRQLVPLDFVKESLTPNRLKDDDGNTVDYYGYHWWLATCNDHPIFYARGILGQYIVMVPDMKLIVVRLGKKRGEKSGNHYQEMMEYVKGAIQMAEVK